MATVSIVADKRITYPRSGCFSPSERYPEYRFEDISPCQNLVYAAVRQCLEQAGLDAEHLGTPAWNPLGGWIRPGQEVFVLCNFVQHRRTNEPADRFVAKCAHGAVLRPLVDYLLIALAGQGKITFGNAPLQSCNWNAVLRDTHAQQVVEFYQVRNQPVEACDLRLFKTDQNRFGAIHRVERGDDSEGLSIDLGPRSELARIANAKDAHFRLLDYDPRRIEAFHSNGSHQYVLNKRVLEADVIVSLPKLKTHEKVGITCALKGCVGAIAHKDCLAHHRLGTPGTGGDEYPSDPLRVKRLISRFHDWAQQSAAGNFSGNVLRVIDKVLRTGLHRTVKYSQGGWSGNDTAWRMALDIARILRFADRNGQMQRTSQREHLVIVDGVVGGQGDGPLSPSPAHRGIVLFSDDLPVADYACATLMGFDPARISLVRESFRGVEYPLTATAFGAGEMIYEGKRGSLADLVNSVEEPFEPPAGWRNAIERQGEPSLSGI